MLFGVRRLWDHYSMKIQFDIDWNKTSNSLKFWSLLNTLANTKYNKQPRGGGFSKLK